MFLGTAAALAASAAGSVGCGESVAQTAGVLLSGGGRDAVPGADPDPQTPVPGPAAGDAGGVAQPEPRSPTDVQVGAADGGDRGDPGPPPLEPRTIVDLETFEDAYVYGPVSDERIDVEGQSFSTARRLHMTQPPATIWSAQLVVPLPVPVARGEVIEVHYFGRCAEPPPGATMCQTELVFERVGGGFTKSVEARTDLTEVWSERTLFFSVVEDYQPGEAQFLFRLGYADQTIELGGMTARSFGAPPDAGAAP